ncbi:MAG: hypothetical protein JWP81_3437 [Ferruginibacter sp.]|nr:hypothetical protein [Ferruginibacter sp.]
MFGSLTFYNLVDVDSDFIKKRQKDLKFVLPDLINLFNYVSLQAISFLSFNDPTLNKGLATEIFCAFKSKTPLIPEDNTFLIYDTFFIEMGFPDRIIRLDCIFR